MRSDSTFQPGRYAAIDIGTVTCRMLVADVASFDHPAIEEVAKEYEVVNLGEGTDASGLLARESMDRAIEAIRGFIEIRDSLQLPNQDGIPTMAVSTSAARDAANSDELVSRLAQLGIELDVIPGTTEAALSFSGATIGFQGQAVAVIDVGGGSCEVAIGIGGEAPMVSHSFDVGCRRVTERFLASDPPTHSEMSDAMGFIRGVLRQWFDSSEVEGIFAELGKPVVIAVAGTATSVVTIRDAIEPYDASLVDGTRVTLEELRDMTEMLSQMTQSEIEGIVGLDPKRAPVILAGLLILEEAVRACGAEEYAASEHDILDGIIMYNSRQCGRGFEPRPS